MPPQMLEHIWLQEMRGSCRRRCVAVTAADAEIDMPSRTRYRLCRGRPSINKSVFEATPLLCLWAMGSQQKPHGIGEHNMT